MGRLLKGPPTGILDVAGMDEMKTVLGAEPADDPFQIVVRVGAQRAKAEGNAVALTLVEREKPLVAVRSGDDAGQAEDCLLYTSPSPRD